MGNNAPRIRPRFYVDPFWFPDVIEESAPPSWEVALQARVPVVDRIMRVWGRVHINLYTVWSP